MRLSKEGNGRGKGASAGGIGSLLLVGLANQERDD